MKTYKKHFDIGFRDEPVLFALGKLYIGSYRNNKVSRH